MRIILSYTLLRICFFTKIIGMYQIKNQIYLDMTKNQKSALCNFLRALVKKSPELSVDDILDKFLEDERYYLEIGNPHFEFLEDYLDNDDFLKETNLYLKECRKYYDYKKKQEPIIQAQKEYEKRKRAFLREVKMSKEPPTKKQVYYYEKLCKTYNLDKLELASKLQARDEIDKIIKEHSPKSAFDENFEEE